LIVFIIALIDYTIGNVKMQISRRSQLFLTILLLPLIILIVTEF